MKQQRSIIFVAGSLRAGTTLMRLVLDAHPDVSCPGESDYLFDYFAEDASPADVRNTSLTTLAHYWMADSIFRAHHAQPPEAVDPIDAIHKLIDDVCGPEPVAVLMIHRRMELARKLFPRSKFIQLCRDPRDVARSAIGMGWAGNVYFGANTWLNAEISRQRLLAVLPPEQSLMVTYEKFVSIPLEECARICSFIGVDQHPAMLDFDHPTYSRPDGSYAEQWRRKLNAREISLIESRCYSLMKHQGYIPENDPPAQPGILLRFSLHIGNKWAIQKFRIRRFGVRLWLEDKISKFLFPNRPYRERIRRRINDVQAAHLR